MEKKIEFLLKMCFNVEVRNLSLSMAHELYDDSALQTIQSAESIKAYIDLDKVKGKLRNEYFMSKFKYENIHNESIVKHLIEKLSEFNEFKYENTGLTHNGTPVNPWTLDKSTGQRSWENYPYMYSKTVLYFSGYNQSKNAMKEVGIDFFGGGSAAEYILTGIGRLRPHVLEAVEYLKSL